VAYSEKLDVSVDDTSKIHMYLSKSSRTLSMLGLC
jgi:hypothetical protein